MKKILLIIIILICPVLVLAKDTCNCKDIIIKDIIKSELSGYTEEKQEPSINNNKIDLGLEMFNINDSITYDITIKNDSEEDYYFTKNSSNIDSDYLEYNLLNTSETIKSKEEKTIQLKITYKNKIPEDSYNENKQMTITLGDEPLTNPDTKVQYILIILIVLITSILFFISKKESMKLLGILLIPLIPIGAKALCSINLEINANITINEKEAIFLPGPEVNVKMKELAGDDTSTSSSPIMFYDENIKNIKYSVNKPSDENKEEKNIVSMSNSQYPIYMWYDNGTIYWWSEDKTPSLNEDASSMFHSLGSLENLQGLKDFDTSNVKYMTSIFYKNESIESASGLENWDTSKAETFQAMFNQATSLSSVEALKNWNTSNVTKMGIAFSYTSLVDLKGLENWDTSKVDFFRETFGSITSLKSAEAIKNWNTTSATDMRLMFSNTALENLQGLENWNVQNVTDFRSMFIYNYNLTDASAINDWNIQPAASFAAMFLQAPVHPEFTKVQGTWNSSGTFIPS